MLREAREGESALELLEAGLTDPDGLFGGWREGVPRRTLSTEDVATVSAVVLNNRREGERRGSPGERRGSGWFQSDSYLPDSD